MALPATDDFEAYGDGDLGAQTNWTNVSNNWLVATKGSDQRVHPNANDEDCTRWNADTFADDQYAQAVVDDPTGFVGVSARCSDSAATYYTYFGGDGGNGAWISKVIAGSRTDLQSGGDDFAATDVVRIECEGTTITPVKNGSTDASLGAQTDSAISSGYAGVGGYGFGNQADGNLDTWEGGNLAAAGNPWYAWAQM